MDGTVSINAPTAIMPWGGIVSPNVAIVSEDLAKSKLLESVIIEKLAITIGPLEKLDYDVPDCSEKDCLFFQERSLDHVIKIGEKVSFGDVLVSKTEQQESPRTAEDKLLKAIFGGATVENTSICMPFSDPGVVADVEVNGNKIFIYIMIKRQLRVGDILTGSKNREFVIGGIVPRNQMPRIGMHDDKRVSVVITSIDGVVPQENMEQVNVASSKTNNADLLLTTKKYKNGKTKWQGTGMQALLGTMSFGKKDCLVEEKSGAICIPPRHVSSQQFTEGIKINMNFAATLHSLGLNDVLEETFTLRSDDVENFPEAYVSIVKEQEFPKAGIPVSLKDVDRVLCGLGLSVKKDDSLKNLLIQRMSSEEILAISSGEITSPETINYKSLIPVPDGLFCQKIFGPIKDYECQCGKYKRIRYEGITCDICGVTVQKSSVRFERFGHIKLALPVVHPLYSKEVGILNDFLTTSESKMGDLEVEVHTNKKHPLFYGNPIDFFKELFESHGIGDTRAIMTLLPVLPANVRPIVQSGGGRFATDFINDLYRRVIIRNGRLAHLIEIEAQTLILRNELAMLQQSINDLFHNISLETEAGTKYKSLDEKLEVASKNLFNKRVAYSGMSIVIPNTAVPLNQVFLPMGIALKIFEPFIVRELLKNRDVEVYDEYNEQTTIEQIADVKTVKSARKMISGYEQRVIDIAKEIAPQFNVLITSKDQKNVFAFNACIWEEEIIGLHPKAIDALHVITGGHGKVYVHLPLSGNAQKETSKILFSEEITVPVAKEYSPSAYLLKYEDLRRINNGIISIPLSEIDKILF